MAWAPDYATAAELRAFVRITDSADDAQIALAIAAASRAIDRTTRRQFGLVATPEARYYTPRYQGRHSRWAVQIDDLMTVTGLEVASDDDGDETFVGDITDYVLRPANAATETRPWTELAVLSTSDSQPTGVDSSVRVTARFGWTTVPDAVKQACLLQSSRLLTRRDSPYGVAGSPQTGSELRLLAKVDPDVEVALADYQRRAPVVFA
jgi:hypothetical protein